MSEPRLLEVARQGDPRAISTLLNAVLLPKRVKAEVSRQGTTLAITLHSEKMLNQGAAVTLIRTALEKLHLPDIDAVVIESRVLGAPLWDAEFRLRSPAPMPESPPVQSAPLPAVEDAWQESPKPSPAVEDAWQESPKPSPAVEDAWQESPEPSPAVEDAWQESPEPPQPPVAETAETPSAPATSEPDAPTLMDLMAAFVESTAPEPVESPAPAIASPDPDDGNEDITLSDLATALYPEPLSDPADLPQETSAAEGFTEQILETADVVSELAEPEALEMADVLSELEDQNPSTAEASSFPPLADPWLEADPSPAPAATTTANAPETTPEPPTEASETKTADYTTPVIEKVPRDGQSKVAGVAGMVMGLGFCATGLGTVIGLPMVVGGMWMLGDEEVWRGDCPHCGQTLKVPVGKLWRFSCPSCQGLIEIKHGRFYRRFAAQSDTRS